MKYNYLNSGDSFLAQSRFVYARMTAGRRKGERGGTTGEYDPGLITVPEAQAAKIRDLKGEVERTSEIQQNTGDRIAKEREKKCVRRER